MKVCWVRMDHRNMISMFTLKTHIYKVLKKSTSLSYVIWAHVLGKCNNRDEFLKFQFLHHQERLCFWICKNDIESNAIHVNPLYCLCISFFQHGKPCWRTFTKATVLFCFVFLITKEKQPIKLFNVYLKKMFKWENSWNSTLLFSLWNFRIARNNGR